MTMLRIGLRFHRTGLIACAAIGGLIGILQSFGFKAVAGASEAARQQFGVQMQVLGRQISYLIPLPVHPETLAGYIQWRVFGFLPLVFGFWALVAGTGVVRGDEERGLLELWLGGGISRARLTTARAAAFVLAAAAAIVIACSLTGLGANAAGSPLPVAGLVADGAALLALTVTCFAIALLIAQLADSRRTAAGVGAIVLLGLFLLNSLGRTLEGPAHFRGISPFFYADQTNGLSPGGQVDWAGTIGLSLAAVVLIALAWLAFSRRDVGSGLVRRRPIDRLPLHQASRNPLLRVPVLATLYEQRLGLLAWMVSIAFLAVFLTSLARSLADIIRSNPVLRVYLSGQSDLNRAVIGVFWFGAIPLLLAIFAITQVSRWTSDDTEGRLEMVLSEPVARWRVALEREGALLVASALIAAAGSLVSSWVAQLQGIGLGIGPVVLATALLLPFGLTFGSLGAAFSGWIPRATVIVLSGYAVAAYFLTQLGPLFKWPAWVEDLSVFYLYGTPLTSGVYLTGLWILLAVTGVALAIGLLSFQRRDLGR
jgi:ABC-2 type transport system permease protein